MGHSSYVFVLQVAADSEVDDMDCMNVKFLPTKEVSETEDLSLCSEQATEDLGKLPSGHDTNKQQFMSGPKEIDETGICIKRR